MKVLVAMSGGVDSSVAAAILAERGFQTGGATGIMFAGDGQAAAVEDARDVARALSIEHHVINLCDEFGREVIDSFVSTYLRGGTPNPCVICNKKIKFGALLDKAVELGYDCIATGHYAGIEKSGGRYLLKTAFHREKDQSYVLWMLDQKQLARTLFPIGEMSKDEVRSRAERLSLTVSNRPDSQDICFIPDGNYRRFLDSVTGEKPEPGSFTDMHGKVLGQHLGLPYYTTGQRRGLNISAADRLYVVRKDRATNTVVLGSDADLFTRRLTAEDVNFIACEMPLQPLRVYAKTRYSQQTAAATVFPLDENRVEVEFDLPQRAVTAGQSVVFYDGEYVVGGGVIS